MGILVYCKILTFVTLVAYSEKYVWLKSQISVPTSVTLLGVLTKFFFLMDREKFGRMGISVVLMFVALIINGIMYAW